ncbi:CYTH-like domain-containing protein [Abortiporus biennis]|nr:CYTH-like domain-containing protein [Abortiporus biennis]
MDHPHSSDSENESRRPPKRPRRSPSPPAQHQAYSRSMSSKPTNGHPPSSALPPLSLSILGVEPIDEFIREVADFIHHTITTTNFSSELYGSTSAQPHVEVEAKIGILKDKMSGQRLQLPVLTETILTPNTIDMRFESNMTAMQHKHINTLLNNLKQDPSIPNMTPIEYQHLHLVDTFYPPPEGSRDKEKIRVTRDEKTSTVKECMKKVRLGNLDIYSPKRAADWRISVNLEIPVPPPLGTATHSRRKDRLSYSHEEFVIDLTQVTSTAGPNAKPEVLHELEIEVARSDYLLSTALKRGDPNVSEAERSAFDELIRAFVNNARILVRNAGDGWQ